MVKQYVGARYVPKFASPVEWAADTSYEALTIVTFNNASYTSKIQVPPTVGNPANNPKYWALTGNYNSQVEQYRQDAVKAQEDAVKAKEDVVKVKEDVVKVKEDVNNNSNNITSLSEKHNQDIDKVEEEINANSNNITNLSNNIALNSMPIRDFINYYGAAHTGDMTELLQTALNECASNNIILFVPSGDYTINSSITLPDNAKLVGAGMFNTRFICNSDFLVGNTPSFECENYFLYGFSANGSKDNQQKGIKLWGVSGTIEYVCMNSFHTGFYMAAPDSDYQSKVHNKEGHYINNCTAMYCKVGFRSLMYDSHYNTIVCAGCEGGWHGGSAKINNLHIWGFSGTALSMSSGQINNLEIEGCTYKSPSSILYLESGNIEINNFYFWNCRTSNYWWILADNCNVIMRNVIIGPAGGLTDANPNELHAIWGTANSLIIEGLIDDSYDAGRLIAPDATIAKAIILMMSKNAITGCTPVSGQKHITLS